MLQFVYIACLKRSSWFLSHLSFSKCGPKTLPIHPWILPFLNLNITKFKRKSIRTKPPICWVRPAAGWQQCCCCCGGEMFEAYYRPPVISRDEPMPHIPWRIHVWMVYLPTWMLDFMGFHVGRTYQSHGSHGYLYSNYCCYYWYLYYYIVFLLLILL